MWPNLTVLKYQDWTYVYIIFPKGFLRLNMENRISIQIPAEWVNVLLYTCTIWICIYYTNILLLVKCNIIKLNIIINTDTIFNGTE